MTGEEAKKMLKAKLECMNRFTTGCDSYCTRHDCNNCSLCYEQGNMGEQKEALELAIKALEQEHTIIIPEHATNEDVIKAVFPNAWKSNYIDSDNKCTLYIDDDYELEVDIDWWNAAYKAESEE